jgi:FMN phosphatase YigB (HAD superfamily)
MKVIALDVDGVLLDFMPAFDKAAEALLGKRIKIHKDEHSLNHYHLKDRIQSTQEDVDAVLQYMIDTGVYANLQPLPGAREALDAIKAEGFKIVLVTALPEAAKLSRLLNLKNYLDFEPDEIHCVGMGMTKGEKLKEIQPDVFIDDRIDYLASGASIYHLAWVDQKESQKDKHSMVDVHVHSLLEWTQIHMPRVVKKLERFYEEKMPLQMDLKLENPNRKYGFEESTNKKLKL